MPVNFHQLFCDLAIYLSFFDCLSALIVQWLGHLVVAEKTWVRFPLGAHNAGRDDNLRRHIFSLRVQEPHLYAPHRSHRLFLAGPAMISGTETIIAVSTVEASIFALPLPMHHW